LSFVQVVSPLLYQLSYLAKSVCGFNKFETRSGKPGITPEKRFIVKVDALH